MVILVAALSMLALGLSSCGDDSVSPVDELTLGDVDGDGLASIADAVIMTNYKLYGEGVLSPDPQFRARQVRAADCNLDGIPLTIADIKYLMLNITGSNSSPIPVAPYADTVVVVRDGSTLTFEDELSLAGVYLKIVTPDGGIPKLVPYAKLQNDCTGDTLIVGSGDLTTCSPASELRIKDFPSDAEILEFELSDCKGYLVYPQMIDSR